MTDTEHKLRALRDQFDRAFAQPPAEAPPDQAELLVVHVAEAPYALRLDELTGIEALGRVVPLPGAPPACLGLRGLRGQLVPVFSLGALLGRPSGRPAWLALGRGAAEAPVGLAFDRLEGARRVALAELAPASGLGDWASVALVDGARRVAVLRLSALFARLTPEAV